MFEERKMIKLNLGCGRDYKKGYINIDSNKRIKADQYFSVEKLPYENNSVDEILAYKILEHFENVPKVLEEWNRVLKPNGLLKIEVPYAFSNYAFADPTHKSFFVWNTFTYFVKGNFYNYYVSFCFKIVTRRFIAFSKIFLISLFAKFASRFPRFYERFLSSIITVDGIYVELMKVEK